MFYQIWRPSLCAEYFGTVSLNSEHFQTKAVADNLAPEPKRLTPEEEDPNLNLDYSYFGSFRATNVLIQLWARKQLKRSFKAKFYSADVAVQGP